MISYDLKFFINYGVLKNIEIKIIWKLYLLSFIKNHLLNLIRNVQ